MFEIHSVLDSREGEDLRLQPFPQEPMLATLKQSPVLKSCTMGLPPLSLGGRFPILRESAAGFPDPPTCENMLSGNQKSGKQGSSY